MDDVPIDNFDYVDHTCDTCVGITYYDKAMKGRNETFLCFGFRSTIDVNNDQELKEYEMQSAKEFDSISCVGKTITTGKMKRLGMAPVKLNGIEFVTTKNITMRGEKDMSSYERRNSVLNERRLALDAKKAKSKEESNGEA